MSYKIFCDNLIEGTWFKELSPLLAEAEFVTIKSRGLNPSIIEEIIKYDRPDIILMHGKQPVLVVEKTQEVPTGHNVGQRIARLVRAVEMEIPTIKFFPFDAMKHGDYAGACNLNIRIIKSFEIMTQLHNVPIFAVNWPHDEHYELVDDGSEDDTMRETVNGYIASGHDKECPEIKEATRQMQEEYHRRLNIRKRYGSPPPSVEITGTKDWLAKFSDIMDSECQSALSKRDESVVYKIGMTPSKCKRQDPYTGTQFIYDYLWCRNGPAVEDKYRNLILHFPEIKKSHWLGCNPNDDSTKSCNWYLTANAMFFSDSTLLLRQ